MSSAARRRAGDEQLLASDPAASVFVAASAGSGKTKLLIDRLLRLMLAGADPARIQCMTYTKAAAAEMALRLQHTLGKWVTLPDAALDAELAKLSVAATGDTRRRARALFAHVLDLPGGMRIGTIHAFCQALLKRFPLEASLSPHFALLDEPDAIDALRAQHERTLEGDGADRMGGALDVLAGLVGVEQFDGLVRQLAGAQEALRKALALGDGLAAAQFRALGVEHDSEAAIRADALRFDESALRTAASVVAAQGSAACKTRSENILDWLALGDEARHDRWDEWLGHFLTEKGAPRAASGFANKKLLDMQPRLGDAFAAEAERLVAVEDRCGAFRMAEASAALMTLAAPLLRAFARRKEQSGQVEYADLIERTAKLLVDPGAAWVLYKLDGGLDHLLLDEVQDTAPEQWDIAGGLTGEFFAGAGAHAGGDRTVFAVGDRKQSIYSFQGADPDGFDHWRETLRSRVKASGGTWRDGALDVSFRSTAPVLALVDRVFAQDAARPGVARDGETLTHYADRADHAGSVEVWPLTPRPPGEEPAPWSVPEENLEQTSAPQTLAEYLAAWIARQTDGSVMLESRGRALRAGDVMVLVRRRNEFGRALVRALKARGVPVAGLDRIVLTEQPAVRDLLALCETLLLPRDDLSLGCVLTSPLGGLSDDSLMQLAAGRREKHLWDTLRERAGERDDWRRAWEFLSALLPRVDYATPHALLTEALGPLGGRARLFARLGPEAAEPVDEMLAAALQYAAQHPPSLQGFVHWLSRSGAEVKREAGGPGGMVRIMTVHGAKGLQAPLVILPDTTGVPAQPERLLWAQDPATGIAVPLWMPNKDVCCDAARAIGKRLAARQIEEHHRLLYVAMTRAEDRLVVCGWQVGRPPQEPSWYDLIGTAMQNMDHTTEDFGSGWDGAVLRVASAQNADPVPERAEPVQEGAALPHWAGSAPGWLAAPPPDEAAGPVSLAPSRPEGVELGPVPHSASPLGARGPDRFRRGRMIHALLQHLPALPEAARRDAALRWLMRPGHALDEAGAGLVADEVLAVLAHAELAPLFGPGSRAEAPLTGLVDGQVVGGLVDRLAVLPDRVLVADYKTNRDPPLDVAETPVLYLRQMAAYRAVLKAIFPGRPITCALVWTQSARVSILPDDLLAGAARPTSSG